MLVNGCHSRKVDFYNLRCFGCLTNTCLNHSFKERLHFHGEEKQKVMQ